MYHLIANPSSQSGRDTQTIDKLQELLRREQRSFRLYYTQGPGSARELAGAITSGCLPEVADAWDAQEREGGSADDRAQQDVLTLIILGGDGTINEVINGVSDFRNLQIGIVPVGSSNDFARGLGLPSDPEAALRRIAAGRMRRTVDLGRITCSSTADTRSRLYDSGRDGDGSSGPLQRLFCVSAGIGYDASICEEALSSPVKDFFNRFHLGRVTYGFIGVRQIFTSPRVRADVEMDGGRTFHTDRMLFSAILNEPYEGGGYRFAPDASDSDGKLNLVVIGDISVPKALLSFPAAHAGRYYSIRGVNPFQVKKVRIRTAEPLWVHTDGEVSVQSDDVTVECLPGMLNLIV